MAVDLTGPLPRPDVQASTCGVVVTARRQLVRDAVSIAMASLGFSSRSTPLPQTTAQVLDLRRHLAGSPLVQGLLIAEVVDAAELRQAAAVLSGIHIEWLVLTGAAPGPAWWALTDAGARDVLPVTTTLEELAGRMFTQRRAEGPTRSAARSWGGRAPQQRGLIRRLERLSAREMQILVALDGGSTVGEIAVTAGVAEGTVRTQVKSMLHKLEVRTQLQAVAALRRANEWLMG